MSAVEGGDASAKTKLAWFKLSGLEGADVDVDGAIALLEERVKSNDEEAKWMLGVCKEFGIGTKQDVKEAVKLYKKSSSGGSETGKSLAESQESERGNGFLKANRL